MLSRSLNGLSVAEKDAFYYWPFYCPKNFVFDTGFDGNRASLVAKNALPSFALAALSLERQRVELAANKTLGNSDLSILRLK